ncbi:PREDICTED: NDR1/HIN1-like protein 12 [Tarenaya hassleriana]|uniref:NDR1/HIN1-like protein 12 n=1 Tax=Tarenaya hassleriana TaxID=28532 RepID=UPI00053C64F4|nr:PREDICTED: NDR1/HIN1-like protein 12 [Tarenaya hassleriana]
MAEGHAKAEHVARVVEEQQKVRPEKAVSSASSTPESYSKGGGGGGNLRRTIAAAVFVVILLVAAIYELNFTAATVISTSVQFSVLARNPNRRVTAHYDRLRMYVTYRDQMITPPVELPPLRLPEKTTVVIAPVMGGNGVPVAPEVANGLRMDESYGVVSMRVVLQGRLRWKAGGIKTGGYGLYVTCDVWLRYKRGFSGQAPLLAPPTCKVDV